MSKAVKCFLFERLENAQGGDYKDVAKALLRDKEATIDRIMPDKLSATWKQMLGDDFEETHENYLNSVANLTLVESNAVLGAEDFKLKCSGSFNSNKAMPGYQMSKYRLARDVAANEQWTKTELEQRMDKIVSTLFKLYPMPQTSFSPLPKHVDEYSLERNAYQMSKAVKCFLFERLENAQGGDYKDVAKALLRDKEATIDRIMPDKLSATWKQMLGDDFEETHENYLNSVANLTLVESNAVLGAEDFKLKCSGSFNSNKAMPGYQMSKYRLARDVAANEQWTKTELEQRMDKIVSTLFKLYPMPQTSFSPLPKHVDEYSLEDEFSPKKRKIIGYRLFGDQIEQRSWKDMFLDVIRAVALKYPDSFDDLFDRDNYFRSVKPDNSQYIELMPNRWVMVNNNNSMRIKCLQYLFDQCEIPRTDLVMILEPQKDKNID